MKKLKFALLFMGIISVADAANITIFYSPTCPHCHHARDFIRNTLIYEYNDLVVDEVNATLQENGQEFVDALNKCKYTSGGVPVMVIGDKCFQGYGEMMNDDIRNAVEIDLTEEQKNSANENRNAMQQDRDGFVSQHQDRQNAVTEKGAKKN